MDFAEHLRKSEVSAKFSMVDSYEMAFMKGIAILQLFYYKQSIFDPRSESCLSFSKKSPQKIV